MCMNALPASMYCTIYVLGALRDQRRAWDPLGLELPMIVRLHVGPGN